MSLWGQTYYEAGNSGLIPDPAADQLIRSYGAYSADDALGAMGLDEAGKDKLVYPISHVEEFYPGCWPGPAQRRGDCVSQTAARAALLTLCCEAASGRPDSVTGKVEEAPAIDMEAIQQGALATEPVYHHRGHADDGWWCSSAANAMVQHTGAVVRKDYGFVDLTNYNPVYAGKYWRQDQIPDEHYKAFSEHRFRDAAPCDSFEAVRDALACGIGVLTCGSEGFSGVRKEGGVMDRKGTWYHAMVALAADDRPSTHSKWGGPLVLLLNSWGDWGAGDRKIDGTGIEIPVGSFWARWKDIKQRSFIAIAGLNGWPMRALPDFNPGWGT